MKQEEKKFAIYNGERPKVLVLGNGICQAFGGKSWSKFLETIKDSTEFPYDAKRYEMPMSIKASMLTKNELANKIKKIVAEEKTQETENEMNWESFVSSTKEQREFLQKLLTLDFDYVLTTNYSYELELALMNQNTARPRDLSKLQNFTEVDHAQTQFMMNTYNSCLWDGIEKQIWHIHGEARKPNSVVIGHYYYGKILRRVVERLDGNRKNYKANLREKRLQPIGSWADAFAWGNVVIMGLGLDFSETDLWWLVAYKNIHKDGKIIFYEPNQTKKNVCALDGKIVCERANDYIQEPECKRILLKNSGVDIRSLDITIQSDSDYQKFYEAAYRDICSYWENL